MAMLNAPTDLCFLTDADFVPSKNSHQLIKEYTNNMEPTRQVVLIMSLFMKPQHLSLSQILKNV